MMVFTAQVVETSVTNNSLSKDYPHPDSHAKQITDTPVFKPFTMHVTTVVVVPLRNYMGYFLNAAHFRGGLVS